jgi:hypothetical protein
MKSFNAKHPINRFSNFGLLFKKLLRNSILDFQFLTKIYLKDRRKLNGCFSLISGLCLMRLKR